MMNFKITGVVFILFCGFYFSYDVKKKYDNRIKVLEGFLKDFEFFINEISFLKTPVNEIILKLKEEWNSDFYDFLLKKGTDRVKERLLNYEYCILPKDANIISGFFQSLGTGDYENQINSLKSYGELLKGRIKEAKNDKEKNQKSSSSLIMCSFIKVIIFLV